MNKKVRKGFLFYLLIMLGVILAAFVLLIVIMIFSPGLELLGLRYFKDKTEINLTQMTVLDAEGNAVKDGDENKKVEMFTKNNSGNSPQYAIDKFVFDVDNYDVSMVVSDLTKLQMSVRADTKGFAKGSGISFVNYSITYRKDASTENVGTCFVTLRSPSGFWNIGENNKLIIEVPKNLYYTQSEISGPYTYYAQEFTNTYLDIKTSGNVTLGGEGQGTIEESVKNLTIKGLSVSCDKLNITEHFYVGTNIYMQSDVCKFNAKSEMNVKNTVYCTSMEMDFGDSIVNFSGNIISTGDITISGKRNDATLKDITCTNLIYKGADGRFVMQNLTGNFELTNDVKTCKIVIASVNGIVTDNSEKVNPEITNAA